MKNITLYECQGDMILVDCGSIFPENDMFGIDLVIPDFTYVLENKDRIKGLFIIPRTRGSHRQPAVSAEKIQCADLRRTAHDRPYQE